MTIAETSDLVIKAAKDHDAALVPTVAAWVSVHRLPQSDTGGCHLHTR